MTDKIKTLPKDYAEKRNKIAEKVSSYWARSRHQKLSDIEHERELKRIDDECNFN
jgi:hypothetical protein